MNSTTKDSSIGWYGIAIGAFFVALASPALIDLVAGRAPSLVVKHVLIAGPYALAATAVMSLIGLGFIAAGLWCFWGRRA